MKTAQSPLVHARAVSPQGYPRAPLIPILAANPFNLDINHCDALIIL